MAQENKDLLLQDLCARLPFGVTVLYNNIRCVAENIGRDGTISLIGNDNSVKKAIYITKANFVKPYLRPMSSMTEEEKKEVEDLNMNPFSGSVTDWLNARHFDYHDLIPKGLALEAPEGMYR